MRGLGLTDQAGILSGQLGANTNSLLQGSLGGMGGINVSSPASLSRSNVQALSYAAFQGAGSPGGTLPQVQGLRLGTSPNAGNSSNLGSIESPLSIGSSFQGGLTVNNLQQMQQVQMHGGLGGSLGSAQLGAASASNISSLLKADQGGQTSSVPSLSGLGLGNGMQGSNLGGLSGYGMAGSLSGNSGLVGQQGAMTFGSPNQGNMLIQQGGLQMMQTNMVNAALAQQQQQQLAAVQQVAARQAAVQQAASLGRDLLQGAGGMALMQSQIGLVQPDAGVGISKDELRLPPDAAPTLYVDGIPADITRREFAHVFRPYDGYKGSRVVMKERETGKSMQVYGFVDFNTPQEAAYAKQQLQGYPMDLEEETTNCLNISYARPLRNPNVVSRRGNKARNKT